MNDDDAAEVGGRGLRLEGLGDGDPCAPSEPGRWRTPCSHFRARRRSLAFHWLDSASKPRGTCTPRARRTRSTMPYRAGSNSGAVGVDRLVGLFERQRDAATLSGGRCR